jgi:very-short-patch-repair endonuclease
MTKPKRWRTTEAIQRRAKELRREQTPAEQKLWAKLRGKQLLGFKFRRQHPIDRFIVDFCCTRPKLVVEIDGDSHTSQAEYDDSRTAHLEELGYTVIRFTNRQVYRQLDVVLDEIAWTLDNLML